MERKEVCSKEEGTKVVLLRLLKLNNKVEEVTVTDQEMLDYARVMGRYTGIFPAPEGAACLAAQVKLLEKGWIQADERVVLFNTGSGLKYAHLWA